MNELKKKESNWWSYILFQFLWLIVIMPKELQFVMLAGISCILIWKGKKQRPNLVVCCVLAYAGCHVLSIGYNAITGEYGIVRILAAGNTALIWIIAAGLYHFYRWNRIDYKKVAGTGMINGVCMTCLAIIFLIGRKFTDVFSLPYINCILFDREKDIYIDRIRFWGFLEYPTLVVAFELLVFPFMFWYAWKTFQKKWCRIIGISAMVIGMVLPIYYSYSRSGYVLLGLEVVIFIFYMFYVRLNSKQKHWLGIGLIFAGFCIVILGHGLYTKVFWTLMNMRAGSNGTRALIYTETLKGFLQHPIIGCGIKAIGSAGYPLGSHSTYLGFLYKTGVLGTIFIIVAFIKNGIQMLRNILCNEDLLIGVCSVTILLLYLFFIFEDVDGADWLVCIWLALSGMLSSGADVIKAGK